MKKSDYGVSHGNQVSDFHPVLIRLILFPNQNRFTHCVARQFYLTCPTNLP
nr:MAG TPA_asm: hypothetical protein [Caudoviricetes sp.]